MIRLRELRLGDAPLMLEWMHDPEIQNGLKKDFLSKTLRDAENFIKKAGIPESLHTGDSIHFAVTDQSDEYLGTISLKQIDMDNLNAEYAICLRRYAQGKGIAGEATKLLLYKAFNEYGLNRVYLNVFPDNYRAIRLYEKIGFVFEGEFRQHLIIKGKPVNWKWYGILKSDYYEKKFSKFEH